ncbi:hypothetical protein PAE4_10636 [Bacillus altitudinis]|nr:hypothetical protein PAE4_10636 [Bacillus altitudinis]
MFFYEWYFVSKLRGTSLFIREFILYRKTQINIVKKTNFLDDRQSSKLNLLLEYKVSSSIFSKLVQRKGQNSFIRRH